MMEAVYLIHMHLHLVEFLLFDIMLTMMITDLCKELKD